MAADLTPITRTKYISAHYTIKELTLITRGVAPLLRGKLKAAEVDL